MGATLIFLDESGFSLVSPLKRTWAPRGQTPVIRTSIQHNARLNLVGARCSSPRKRKIKLHLHTHHKSITGDEIMVFLQALLRCIAGPIVLVWDKHPIHGRQKVKDFLRAHPRLHAYDFPTAAPELNPTEFVWTQLTAYTANSAPRNSTQLQTNVMAGVARLRRVPHRLWACVFASALPWER